MIGQVFQITLLSLRNLPSRLGSSSVIVVGIGGVVGVLVAILAMAKGFEASMSRAGQPDRAIVMRGGSTSELSSGMGPGEMAVVGSWSEVTAASGELYLVADVPKRSNQSLANLAIRGVEQDAFEIRPEISIVEGRSFVTGRTEMIAGRGAVAEFEGVETGSTIELRNSTWTIVGMFEADGSVYESEVWADLATAQSIFRREGGVSSMRVRLASPDAADVLSQRMEDDPRLDLTLTGEDEYFKSQSQQLTTLIETFGYGVAAIMAVGAIFAALNTMYTAVSARTVEIATLRALGFGGMPVVASVVIEALLLALLGGAVGAAVAYFGFNGWTVSTLGGSFSQVAFDFAVTPELLVFGIVWAVGLGLVGGMFPAVRAARLPITTALRGE
ncbi:MAG: FtsX-like permease family protein [Gammaproteobacteria bacterium]|nr:FtsX-like permease family protein [Gammaproteobacteria bacterium]MDE0452303.1 FtsX-like permease family protein [Gammaproteobacteria bacterium]